MWLKLVCILGVDWLFVLGAMRVWVCVMLIEVGCAVCCFLLLIIVLDLDNSVVYCIYGLDTGCLIVIN